MALILALLLLAVSTPQMEDCQKIYLKDAHTKKGISVCLIYWNKIKSLDFDIVCMPTDHGHKHLLYVLKKNVNSVLMPYVNGKPLVCVGT